MSKYDTLDRRTAIKGIGGLLAGGIIPTTGAAASVSKDSEQHGGDNETTGFDSELDVENGRVVVTGESTSQSIATRFGQIDSGIELNSESIAGFLNNGIEREHFDVYEEGETVMVEPTVSPESITSSTPSLSSQQVLPGTGGGGSCGQSVTRWNITPSTVSVTIKMDHTLTERVILAFAAGAAVSGIAAAVLSATGVGAAPGIVAAAVGAALAFAATALSTTDNGCGVVIEFTYYPYASWRSGGDFYPQ